MNFLSVTLPVYNEEKILNEEITKIIAEINSSFFGCSYELLLVENGSTDNTCKIIEQLIAKFPKTVRVVHIPVANYGLAIKECLLKSCGEYTVIFNVDFWDIDFVKQSLKVMNNKEVSGVIGSKTMPGAKDNRIWLRRFITRSFNILLATLFGFKGTDTHGIKMFKTEKIIPVVQSCVTDGVIFDTELILRAQKTGLKMEEVPVMCEEKRKTRLNILESTFQTVKDLLILFFLMRDK